MAQSLPHSKGQAPEERFVREHVPSLGLGEGCSSHSSPLPSPSPTLGQKQTSKQRATGQGFREIA